MKKFSILVLITALLLSLFLGCICYAADDEYESGYNAGYDDGYSDGKASAKSRTPEVKLIQPAVIPTVNAGETLELELNFKNHSKDNAHSLRITPEFEDSTVLVYERPLSYSTTVTLKGGQEGKTTFKILTYENAKKGTYSLKLKFEYKNVLGDIFTREEMAYFKVVTEKQKPILNVSNIAVPSDLQYGSNFNVSFDITNIGGSEATDIEIKLEGFSNSGIMPVDSKDYVYIPKLDSDKTLTQNFNFKISDDIETKDNTITATITYKSYDDKDYTTSKSIYITNVKLKEKESEEKKEEKEDPKYAKPKMIISSYSVSPQNIVAGDEFVFSFNFKNTSKDRAIRNIKVTVSSFEGCFIITKGSNTFYIESMGTQQSIHKQIELKAKQDLTSNSYEVLIAFDYEDYDGNEYSSQEKINVPVTEFSKLVINSAGVTEGYINNPTSLSFDYVNMGKATISNLTATVTGDFEPTQETTYIGNVQAGNSDYYDIEVIPTKEGINYGKLILTFEDSSGRPIEVSRDFEGSAFPEQTSDPSENPSEQGDIPMPVENEGVNFKVWQIILAGVGAFLVVFIIVRMITKKIVLKKFEDDI